MDSGLDQGPLDIYRYTATIQDTTLVAGSYLLSIVNNTAADTNDSWFCAASSALSQGHWGRENDGDSWGLRLGDLAFNISGTVGVPDTGTSALFLGLGFIAVLVFRRGLGAAEKAAG